jgi:hypothetical protein
MEYTLQSPKAKLTGYEEHDRRSTALTTHFSLLHLDGDLDRTQKNHVAPQLQWRRRRFKRRRVAAPAAGEEPQAEREQYSLLLYFVKLYVEIIYENMQSSCIELYHRFRRSSRGGWGADGSSGT